MRRGLLAVAATVLALGVSELLVRAFAAAPVAQPIYLSREDSPDVVYRRSQNPILGFELKRSYGHPHPDFRQSYERTNAHGQRDVERSLEKAPGVRRVVLLGESVVVGHGLRQADTISRQLERLHLDGRTQVLNFGTSGYSTRAEVELLETRALAFEPDVVIVVFVENDFDNFSPEAFRAQSAFERPEWVERLFLSSHFFRLLCVQLDLFHFGVDADPLAWNQRAISENNVVAGFERLRELALEHDFEPVIAIWPHFYDDGVRSPHPMPGDPDTLLVERLAAMYGLPTVRLASWFAEGRSARSGRASPRRRYSLDGDGFHPTAEAATIAARALADVLAELDAGRLRMDRGPLERKDIERDLLAVDAARQLGRERVPNYAVAWVEEGARHQATGRYEEAARHYRVALDADPRFVPALLNLGVLLAKQGRLDEAAAWLELALAVDDSQAETHYALGTVYSNLGRLEVGAARFRQAIRLRPDHAPSHRDYGATLIDLGRTGDAVAAIRQALYLDPDDAQAHNHLGSAYARTGDLELATVALQRAIGVDAAYAAPHLNLGYVMMARNDIKSAITQFRLALEIAPGYEQAEIALAAAQSTLWPTGLP